MYHVAEKGVEVVRSWSSGETITAFVDGDEDYKPKYMITRRRVQLIVASFSKGASLKWIKKAGRAPFVTEPTIKPWSQSFY